jgi:hypothetical protein
MLVLAIGAFVCGLLLLPGPDLDAPLPEQVAVAMPIAISDGRSWMSFKQMSWSEYHDDALKLPPEPPLAPHNIRFSVIIEYSRNDIGRYGELGDSKASPIDINFELPDKAEIANCQKYTDTKPRQIAWHQKVQSAIVPPGKERIKRYLQISSVVEGNRGALSFFCDAKGVDGLTFTTNRTRAVVRTPRAELVTQMPSMSQVDPHPTFAESVAVGMRGAEEFTWSPRAIGQGADWVSWVEKSDNPSSASITGVREDVLRGDHNFEIWAGIAFGLGGGAFIGVFQSAFAALRERRKEQAI